MCRRCRIGIRAPVASQQKKPVATATVAGKSASAITHWPRDVGLVPDTLLGLAAQRPAHRRAFRPDRPAQHHLLGLSRFTRAKINALAETYFGAGRAQPPAHPTRQSEQNRDAFLGQRGLYRGM